MDQWCLFSPQLIRIFKKESTLDTHFRICRLSCGPNRNPHSKLGEGPLRSNASISFKQPSPRMPLSKLRVDASVLNQVIKAAPILISDSWSLIERELVFKRQVCWKFARFVFSNSQGLPISALARDNLRDLDRLKRIPDSNSLQEL